MQKLAAAAEEAARRRLLSTISVKRISDFDVTVEAVGGKPLVLNIDVYLELKENTGDPRMLVDEATGLAFSAAEAKAKELDICVGTLN